MNVNVTERDAENILFALALRVMQLRTLKSEVMAQETLQLGTSLNLQFEKQFGWDECNRMAHYLYPMKSVRVAFYPTNPNPKP